jgi:hypothetical protein
MRCELLREFSPGLCSRRTAIEVLPARRKHDTRTEHERLRRVPRQPLVALGRGGIRSPGALFCACREPRPITRARAGGKGRSSHSSKLKALIRILGVVLIPAFVSGIRRRPSIFAL